jgi:hypothetical protein
MRSHAVYASSKGREPNADNKKTDLVASSEEDRIRNIVLFWHSFSKKCKQGFDVRDVRLPNAS